MVVVLFAIIDCICNGLVLGFSLVVNEVFNLARNTIVFLQRNCVPLFLSTAARRHLPGFSRNVSAKFFGVLFFQSLGVHLIFDAPVEPGTVDGFELPVLFDILGTLFCHCVKTTGREAGAIEKRIFGWEKLRC